jgi:molybdate transport system substrate-binding protein
VNSLVRIQTIMFLVCTLALVVPATAAELKVAAAADLKFALDELVVEFQENQPTINVSVTYGSSGNFFAQLQSQAPFDLYFSADIEYPRKLAASGLALDDNVFTYAVGRIVVWAPRSSPIDVNQDAMEVLLNPGVKKIAIANPRHAPYGVAAKAALQSLGVYDQVESKLVYGENIAQAAQFVQSGAADVGILALSLAIAPQLHDLGQYWEIPLDAYPKLEQGGIILNWTEELTAARSLRDFILGEHGRAVLIRYGFFLPEDWKN